MSDVRTYTCDDCGRSITVGPSGTEYGHERGHDSGTNTSRCPRRSTAVDPWRRGERGGTA